MIKYDNILAFQSMRLLLDNNMGEFVINTPTKLSVQVPVTEMSSKKSKSDFDPNL